MKSIPPTDSRDLLRVATKNRQRIGYRRAVQLLIWLVIIPTSLILSVGIVLMFVGEKYNVVFGILNVAFVALVVTGVSLTIVFVRREANLSELQADFVSKVSHELRTPLTAIRLFAETIVRTGDDKTRRECSDRIITESERLGARIDRLLDWGRMEAGRKVYDLREEQVAPIIDETATQFRSMTTRSDFVFDVACDAATPPALVDRHAIVDLLLNLLTNALKYGGSPARIGLRAFAAPSGEAVIEVSDNGGGIARGEHRRIFEKFYRIDDRLSRTREGSGLGLAIVKHIVRAHRARIEVDSELGRGSIFRVVLPRWSPRRRGPTS
jgi:two-component system phosphate regulon sensor histidine kinase PhoR